MSSSSTKIDKNTTLLVLVRGLADKIGHLPAKQQAIIRKTLLKIIGLPTDKHTKDTGKSITILAHDDGETEYFFGGV
jgi:hypothetical protein